MERGTRIMMHQQFTNPNRQLYSLALLQLADVVLGSHMVLIRLRRGGLHAQLSTTSVKSARSKVTISRLVSNALTVVHWDIKARRAIGARKETNCRLQKTRRQP